MSFFSPFITRYPQCKQFLAMGRWQAIEPFLFSLYRNTKTRREPYSSREGPSQSLVVMKLSLLFMAILAFPSITLSMSLSGNESPADNEAYWLDLLNQNRFEKRKFAANDPRSLFASVYANYKLVHFCNFLYSLQYSVFPASIKFLLCTTNF